MLITSVERCVYIYIYILIVKIRLLVFGLSGLIHVSVCIILAIGYYIVAHTLFLSSFLKSSTKLKLSKLVLKLFSKFPALRKSTFNNGKGDSKCFQYFSSLIGTSFHTYTRIPPSCLFISERKGVG